MQSCTSGHPILSSYHEQRNNRHLYLTSSLEITIGHSIHPCHGSGPLTDTRCLQVFSISLFTKDLENGLSAVSSSHIVCQSAANPINFAFEMQNRDMQSSSGVLPAVERLRKHDCGRFPGNLACLLYFVIAFRHIIKFSGLQINEGKVAQTPAVAFTICPIHFTQYPPFF